MQKDGEKLPGKKGLMLPLEEWALLSSQLPQLQQALQAGNLDMSVQLSGTRRATVSEYKKRVSVDVREWYDKDGELKPGIKGVSLAAEALQVCIPALLLPPAAVAWSGLMLLATAGTCGITLCCMWPTTFGCA